VQPGILQDLILYGINLELRVIEIDDDNLRNLEIQGIKEMFLILRITEIEIIGKILIDDITDLFIQFIIGIDDHYKIHTQPALIENYRTAKRSFGYGKPLHAVLFPIYPVFKMTALYKLLFH
jgi:hypothetical protein